MDASNNGLMLTRYYQNLNYFGHIQTENFNSSALVCSRVDVTLNQALNKVYKLIWRLFWLRVYGKSIKVGYPQFRAVKMLHLYIFILFVSTCACIGFT